MSRLKHNVNHADDEDMKRFDFGWIGSYNQRGLCVRIVCPVESKEMIQCVKFITRDDTCGQSLSWNESFGLYSLEGFYEHIKSQLREFECHELSFEYWHQINKHIDLMNYKYLQKTAEKNEQWTSNSNLSASEMETELSKLSKAQRSYLSSLDVALKVDMQDGEAKDWMNDLVTNLLLSGGFSAWDIKYSAASQNSRINSFHEIIYDNGDEEKTFFYYNSPYDNVKSFSSDFSSFGSSSSTEKGIKCGMAVPGFYFALAGYPGVFPLVVEMRSSAKEKEGEFQNIKQMISKMFFQEVIFGLIVSPKCYEMSVIIRKDGELHYTHTLPKYFVSEKDRLSGNGQLDIESLNEICSFIFRVIKWSMKTRCNL